MNQVELALGGLQLFPGGLQLFPELTVEVLDLLLLLLDVGLLTAQSTDTALQLGINTQARSPSLNQGFPEGLMPQTQAYHVSIMFLTKCIAT